MLRSPYCTLHEGRCGTTERRKLKCWKGVMNGRPNYMDDGDTMSQLDNTIEHQVEMHNL